MPRISTRIILQAYQHNPLLPILLRECRSLESAKNELRWLRERALCIIKRRSVEDRNAGARKPAFGWGSLLKSMCLARSKGMPLQYILGDQPFGDLDIKCTKGVLIPRHETEAIVFHAAKLILGNMPKDRNVSGDDEQAPLLVMDLCTGTGCIPLLLHALLSPHFPRLSIVGIDVSAAAIKLARENTERNVRLGVLSGRALSEVSFQQGNVLEYGTDGSAILEDMFNSMPGLSALPEVRCDVLISNPPYVSPEEYHDGTTSRSVRIFEPKLALVPPADTFSSTGSLIDFRREDLFYHHFVSLLTTLDVKLTVFECGSHPQAVRVAAFCRDVLCRSNVADQTMVDIWPVTGFDTDPCAVLIHGRGYRGSENNIR